MHKLLFVVVSLCLVACSGDDAGQGTPNNEPNNVANNGADGGGDGGPNNASNQPNNDTLDDGIAPNNDPDGGNPPGDMATPNDMGSPPDDMGAGLAPTIPQPNGACPTFEDGEQDIMGLATDMLVGAPVATPGPLLFIWHGTGSSGDVSLNFQLPQSVKDDIVAQGGIIIAPNDNLQARTGFTANGVWYEESDLEYADHLVACAVQDHNIDPRRIYVTGCSAGGLMAASMAIRRSSYVAAVSPNSGGQIQNNLPPLENPDWAPPTLCMHGGATDNVVVNFGQTSARFNDFITGEGGFAVDCNHLSGHCTAPNELRLASWEFLKAHTYGMETSPYAAGLPAEFPDYCDIW